MNAISFGFSSTTTKKDYEESVAKYAESTDLETSAVPENHVIIGVKTRIRQEGDSGNNRITQVSFILLDIDSFKAQ